MRYLKATAVGLLAALLFVLATVVLPVVWAIWQSTRDTASGGIGAVSVGLGDTSILAAAIVGFLVGFVWTVRSK